MSGAMLPEPDPTVPCPITNMWVGHPCGRPAVTTDGHCSRHAGMGPCSGCGGLATTECGYAYSIAVCGAPLCDTCEHRDSARQHYPRASSR